MYKYILALLISTLFLFTSNSSVYADTIVAGDVTVINSHTVRIDNTGNAYISSGECYYFNNPGYGYINLYDSSAPNTVLASSSLCTDNGFRSLTATFSTYSMIPGNTYFVVYSKFGVTNQTHDFLFPVLPNEAPEVSGLQSKTVDINEANIYTESGSFSDEDSTSWTGTVDYGDGSGIQSLTLNPDKTFSLNHAYQANGIFTLIVEISDNNGGVGSSTAQVNVNTPRIASIADETISSGQTYIKIGSFTDPDSTSWTGTVDYGDGSGIQPLTINPDRTFDLSHVYVNSPGGNGADSVGRTITVNITDNQGTTGAGTAEVSVHNVVIAGDVTVIDPNTIRIDNAGYAFFGIGCYYFNNIQFYGYIGLYSASDSNTVLANEASCTDVSANSFILDFTNYELNSGNYNLVYNTFGYTNKTNDFSYFSEPQEITINSSADSNVRNGQDNRNYGASNFMRVRSNGFNRALVKFDQNAIAEAVGEGEILSAKVVLIITENGENWGSGRTVDIHRLISNWSEGNGTEDDRGTGNGATWACATDSIIENQSKNCSGTTEWEMGQPNNPEVHPWIETPTDSLTVTNGLTGEIEYDVTTDVQSFFSGANSNFGWIIRKTNEGQNGLISFGTKESSYTPQLVITYQP